MNKRELREADFIEIKEHRSNLPFVQDWPKSDFPDRNYARLKVARSEDRALLGSNPSAEWVNYTGGARCYLAPFFSSIRSFLTRFTR